ncbi:MAG: hypothetical protein QOH12_2996 [Solirubrobacteraceae bacterium]|jgi:hypothetical protein|nr:hypothetical protein [Solirubrobacteraceae bacterium]
MIALRAELVENLGDLEGLREAVQKAIELEHATLPTYLYALYSIVPGHNREIKRLVKSVILEEMLHMRLACNILNAIGGSPVINRPDFIPTYPGPLPGAVEGGLTVPLSPLSVELVENVFMVIEEPEDSLEFPGRIATVASAVTIGQFYTAIAEQITKAGDGIFTGELGLQVTGDLGSYHVDPITNAASAVAAIGTIIEQGEGTTQAPIDAEGELAHYYRFAEIVHGRYLVANASPPPDYSYSGGEIPFEEAGVRRLVVNPTTETYAPGSGARRANDNFNYTYTSLLKSLHATFNGQPDELMTAVGLMESCKTQALEMGRLAVGDGTFAGPSFSYQPVNPWPERLTYVLRFHRPPYPTGQAEPATTASGLDVTTMLEGGVFSSELNLVGGAIRLSCRWSSRRTRTGRCSSSGERSASGMRARAR